MIRGAQMTGLRWLILAVAMVAGLSVPGRGADLQKIVQETQRMSTEPSKITLVWWIPTEFWDAALSRNEKLTAEQKKEFNQIMKDYMLFAVAAVDMGPMGGMVPKDRATINANTQLLIDGKKVEPVGSDQVSPGARNFVTMMKPLMANMLGQFGQSLEFMLYPNPAPGASRIDPTKPGEFAYVAFGNRFNWRLPLGSLLPPRVDGKTGESFPGNYNFNPFTGDKLETAKEPPAGGPATTEN